ncbi:MAG TPA: DUF1440 domain-containing protein [Gemmatimonadales bacterium]|nr:DUF1440 domain-containing protein [Gemmatimonadales bacterium]
MERWQRRMRRMNEPVGASLVRGVVAGVAAGWVMGRVTTWLYERESASVRDAEDDARGGSTAYQTAARKGAEAFGAHFSTSEAKKVGTGIHWALAAGAGMAYAALRRRMAHPGLLSALEFGLAFWLVMDEVMVPALGLTPGPTAFPWQTHARGLAGHLAFAEAAEAALSVMPRGA